ncbi:hypothetical protein RQP46_007991 [Phenoliferia psychrophenolica]
MTDASTAGAAPAASPTNLLSLPIEILSKIASDAAPNGGAKAGDLRLVCKALNAVARRTVMSSLHCQANTRSGGELLTAIQRDEGALCALVTSFRLNLDPSTSMDFVAPIAAAAIQRLARLERLDIMGALTDDHEGGLQTELFPLAITRAFSDFPATLQHVCIRLFDLSAAMGLQMWAPGIVKLDLVGCDGWYGFYDRSPPPSMLDVLTLGPRYTPDEDWPEEATEVIRMVAWAAPHTRYISLRWTEAMAWAGASDHLLRDENIWTNSPLETFHLRGLPGLWDPANPQWTHVLPLLTALGTTKLRKLTLPISAEDELDNAFSGLLMPTVTTLCLENEGKSMISLNLEVFRLLESLLSSFSNLETLQLHNWLEEGPRDTGDITSPLLVRRHPMVFLLLSLLATTKVTSVIFRHSRTSGELRFWRDEDKGGADWSSEIYDLY